MRNELRNVCGLLASSSMGILLVLVCALLLSAVGAGAQVGTASIYGQITDAKGLSVEGAKVTLSNKATGLARTMDTDSAGRYEILSLQPGTYKIQVEAKGFRMAVQESIGLLVDTATRADYMLEVGALSETVMVTETPATINTTNASIGNVFTEEQIQHLPLEAGNVVHLLSLQPGAVYLPTGDSRSGSISGSRSDQSNVTLDGIDVNDPQNQTAYTSMLRMTRESVQEFRVTTSNYSAEQGRSSAAQVSLVTKSGTNTLHGSAYWTHRNSAFSANEFFNKISQINLGKPNKPPTLNKHLWGASLGGPIIKDRLFLFGNLENLREKAAFSTLRAVPSKAFRDGVLTYKCASAARCPATTVRGLSGGSYNIAAGNYGLTPAEIKALDPLGIGPNTGAIAYFQRYPDPSEAGKDGLNIVGSRIALPTSSRLWTLISRADYNIDRAGKHALFVRGNYQDDTINERPSFVGQPPSTVTRNLSKGMAVGYTAALTHFVNTFRYGYTRIQLDNAGLRNSDFVSFRFLTDIDARTTTDGRHIPVHNFVNDSSWTTNKHILQFGTNVRITRNHRYSNATSFHSVSINPSWVLNVGRRYQPGGADCSLSSNPAIACSLPTVSSQAQAVFADPFVLMLAVLTQSTGRYNNDKTAAPIPHGEIIRRTYGANEFEGYIQDNWKIHPTLNLTFGVRYGLYSPPWEVNGQQVAPTSSLGDWMATRGSNATAGIPQNAQGLLHVDLAGKANGRRGFYNTAYNNWAPRFSFAWNPRFHGGGLGWLTGGDKLVIRGGYGIVYDRIGHALATTFDTAGAAFGLSTLSSSPVNAVNEDTLGVRFVNFTTMPRSLPRAPKVGFPGTPPEFTGEIQNSFDSSIVTPYAQMFDFAIARQLPGKLALEIAYVGRQGRHLLVRRDLAMYSNLVDPKSGLDYFTAAQQVIQDVLARNIPFGAPRSAYSGVPNHPYFQNLFPDANLGLGLSATQEIARRFNRDAPDYTTSIWLMDQNCIPGCSIFGPYAYWSSQYDSLAGQSSIGYSKYNSMQLTLRKQRGREGLDFAFNYTLSKSFDNSSNVERGGAFGEFSNGGYTGFLVNSWNPRLNHGYSDFDVRHQMNLNWAFDLPFGRNKLWGSNSNGFINSVFGDWELNGISRWTSGFPFNVTNCRSCWPTNWNLQGNAVLLPDKGLPALGTTLNAVGGSDVKIKLPSPFTDPADAVTHFRRGLPGEQGLRNVLRGDGFFSIDLGIAKSWTMPYMEGHKLAFQWQIFNLTNTKRFDTGSVDMTPDITSTFGSYNSTIPICAGSAVAPGSGGAGRCMQFGLRYSF